MRSRNRRRLPWFVICCAFAGILAFPGAAARSDEPKKEKPLRVCLLSGCNTYHSEKSLPPFQEWLEKNYRVECTRLVRKADDDLPGLEKLDECDVAFVFFKRMSLKGEQLERFQKYVRSGRPIVAVRTASHAVQTWLDFDREILGGNYQGHYEKEPVTQIELTDAGKQHPILKGVTLKSAPGPLYKNTGHAKDITILLTGANPGQVEPLAWVREREGGRIFYTSLGDPTTFEDENFRRLLANAVFWTARREIPSK
jgi:type 1 glutamine amidotransferase